MKRITSSLILLFLFHCSNQTLACSDSPIRTATKYDGTKIGIFVSPSKISNTGTWSPDRGDPPLSIKQVYDLVTVWSKTEFSRYDDVKISEITLREHPCHIAKNHWFYSFDLVPVIEGNEVWAPGNWVVVLFDGTIITPREVNK